MQMIRSGLIKKTRFSYVQSPGCSLENTNGITLPLNIRNPIPVGEISALWLSDWDIAVNSLLLQAAFNGVEGDSSDEDGENEQEHAAVESFMLTNDANEQVTIGRFGFLSSDDEME